MVFPSIYINRLYLVLGFKTLCADHKSSLQLSRNKIKDLRNKKTKISASDKLNDQLCDSSASKSGRHEMVFITILRYLE